MKKRQLVKHVGRLWGAEHQVAALRAQWCEIQRSQRQLKHILSGNTHDRLGEVGAAITAIEIALELAHESAANDLRGHRIDLPDPSDVPVPQGGGIKQ